MQWAWTYNFNFWEVRGGTNSLERKLQQFYIIKTKSNRLKQSNYSIYFEDIDEMRKNGEVVSIGESQLVRSLFKITGKDQTLQTVREEVSNLSKSKSSRIKNAKKIDELLFIPELVSLVVENKNEYKEIIKNGLFINDKKYVRLLCGAGHARRDNVVFIQEEFEKPLKKILNNDRDLNVKIAPAKFNAYFALCSSATYEVSTPYFAVVKDMEITRGNCLVEIVDETKKDINNPYEDDAVYETEMELQFNLFDGQGLISPKQAEIWAEELGLDYIPSTFIIRNSFMKGMITVFDFHEFAKVYGKKIFQDVWGNNVDIRNVDIILTESQLKMWRAYSSHADYVDKSRTNDLTWGVSRYAPKYDSDYIYSNYQFLQVENFTEEQIKNISKKTVDFFGQAIGYDPDITKLYLLGKLSNGFYEDGTDVLSKISDPITKALLLDESFIEDQYIKSHIVSSLNKKIKESYIGTLLFDGNYQTIISDPYALCQHVFGMEVSGLLVKDKHYSYYWLEKEVDTVAAMRAPLTWRSEVNILNLVRNEETEYWYQYIRSGIIYNIHGYDTMLQADSDFDGDLIMTTNQPDIIKNASGGLPVTYIKNATPKEIIDEDTLFEYDIKAFDSRIGFITNCSTTLYSMLPLYEEGSEKYNKIIQRLKICRKEQGNQIDKAKGLIIKPFPKFWTKWTKITPDNVHLSDIIELNNTIVVDKRPYFMRYLYPNYNKKYLTHIDNYDKYCYAKYGKPFAQLTEEDYDYNSVVERYKKFSPLLDSNCTMNNICRYMEKEVKEIRVNLSSTTDDRRIMLMKDNSIPFDTDKYKKMEALFRKYRNERSRFNKILADSIKNEGNRLIKFKTIEQYNKAIRSEALSISSSLPELVNLAVAICYELYPSDRKSFLWSVFGDGVIDNIKNNILNSGIKTIKVPFISLGSELNNENIKVIDYMGKKYINHDVNIVNDENEDYDTGFDLGEYNDYF